jgi:transposase
MSGRIVISPPERKVLKSRARTRSGSVAEAMRARIVLSLAAGHSQAQTSRQVGCSVNTVRLWQERFMQERLGGLYGRHHGRSRSQQSIRLEARVLHLAQRKPTDGSTHWSTRKIAAAVGTNHVRVTRILAKAGLQPHRLRRYLCSNDPEFEEKAADIIGLYLKPPLDAAVFCVDEKSAIQALDRLDPVLPLSPGRAERHGFEYYRHGTLSLFAALNAQSGEVLGKTSTHHTSAEFVAFLEQIVASQTPAKEIHIIVDNLSTHRSSKVWQFLERNRNVRIHYTPTYSSWLNQVEIWFSKIQRDVVARGIFCSVKDLARKLIRYIRTYNKKAKPFKWTYAETKNRIRSIKKSM